MKAVQMQKTKFSKVSNGLEIIDTQKDEMGYVFALAVKDSKGKEYLISSQVNRVGEPFLSIHVAVSE